MLSTSSSALGRAPRPSRRPSMCLPTTSLATASIQTTRRSCRRSRMCHCRLRATTVNTDGLTQSRTVYHGGHSVSSVSSVVIDFAGRSFGLKERYDAHTHLDLVCRLLLEKKQKDHHEK